MTRRAVRWNRQWRSSARPLFALPLPPGTEHGSFFAPRAFLLQDARELRTEIFGPVLCVVRYAANGWTR